MSREGKDGACIDECFLLDLNNSLLDHLVHNDLSEKMQYGENLCGKGHVSLLQLVSCSFCF